VIDDAERADVGSIGVEQHHGLEAARAVGVVTDATARDTDEVATEKMPLYFRQPRAAASGRGGTRSSR